MYGQKPQATRAILLFGFLVLTVLLSWQLMGGKAQPKAAPPLGAATTPTSAGDEHAGHKFHAAGDESPDSHRQVVHGVQLAVPVEKLLSETPEGAGGLAVDDDDGNVYYTQVGIRGEARLWRRDAVGKDQLLWSTPARDRHIEIAGRRGDKLTLIFPTRRLKSAADAWRHNGAFYGLDLLTAGVGVWPDPGVNKDLKAHFAAH